MRASRAVAASLAAVLVAALFAGCGGESSDSAQGSPATSDDGPSETVPSTVRIAIPRTVPPLDPNTALQVPTLYVLNLIGGTLMGVGPSGQDPQPLLAESLTESDDGLAWTVVLKPDTKFSDGTPLTAQDVKATFDRAMTDEGNAFASLVAPIEAVQTPDDTTVVFKLKTAYGSLPSVLATPPLMILPAAGLAKGKSFFDAPVSAGPYKLDSYTQNEVKLSRNDDFVGPAPVLEALEITRIEDPSTQVAQLKTGQIQWAEDLPASTIPQLTGDVRVVVSPQFRGDYIYMNNAKPPLDDVKVRQAISYAVDREQFSAVAYGGKASKLDSFFPETMIEHEATVDPERDLDKAKELLQGTACESGCEFTVNVESDTPNYVAMATVLQQNLDAVGIKVNIVPQEATVMGEGLQSGDYQANINGLLAFGDYPDQFLSLGLQSDGGVKALYSNYASEEMDKAIAEVVVTAGEEREAVLSEINALFAEDLPFVPLLNYVSIAGTTLPGDQLQVGSNGLFYVAAE